MIKRLQDLFQTHVEIGQEFISFVSNMLCCLNLGVSATSGPGIIFYWFTLWDPTLLPSSTRKNLHWEKLRLWAAKELAFDDGKRSKTKVQNTSCAITTGAQPSFKRKGKCNRNLTPLF